MIYEQIQVLRKLGMVDGSGPGPVIYRGTDPSDDVFAFGTLLFETFAGGKMPFNSAVDSDDGGDIAARILSNRLPDAIQELDLTTVREWIPSLMWVANSL